MATANNLVPQGGALVPVLSTEQYLQAVESRASTLLVQAGKKRLVAESYQAITDATVYELACADLQELNSLAKQWEEERLDQTRPLDATKKRVMDAYRGALDAATQGVAHLKARINDYLNEQERIRLTREAEARRIQEEAQRKADEEAAAARRAAEEAQRLAQQAQTPEEQERAATVLAEAAAKVEEATQTVAEVMTAPTPIVATTAPKVAGIQRKTTWRGECHNFTELAIAVGIGALIEVIRAQPEAGKKYQDVLAHVEPLSQAFGTAPITLLELNQTTLNQMAKALKAALAIPGCKAVEDKNISAGRR